MKRVIALVVISVPAVIGLSRIADAGGHDLVVDAVHYDSTHEAGGTIQWETPTPNPQEASFAERGQTWSYGDNGTDKLPCPGGVHWVSNTNNLVISHCLEAQPSTTTTSSTSSTTTIASTSTLPTTSSTSTNPVTVPSTTTTVAPTTPSTSSPSTTSPDTTSSTTTTPGGSDASTSTSTVAAASTTTSAPTTTAPGQPASTSTSSSTTDPQVPTSTLPNTGAAEQLTLLWLAAVLLVSGLVIIRVSRRP